MLNLDSIPAKMHKDVKAWWPKHKEADRQREAAEQAAAELKVRKANVKKRILAAVSAEDLATLGIKL